MGLLSVILISIGLAMDCFAVSISAGTCTKNIRIKNILFIASMFGFFQAGMTFIGWAAGSGFSKYIEAYDHWVAFFLLLFIGGRMIYESFKEEHEKCLNYTAVKTVLVLAVATSIDALAVGISFSLMKTSITTAVIIIGFASFIFSVGGVFIGNKTGELLGSKAELVGGLILIGIGIKILVSG